MKRRLDFDLLRMGCMCAVVYLHTASSSFYDLSNRPLWAMSCLVNAFSALAVPLFFMMSGALALAPGAKAEPGYVLRRRVGKVLPPLIAWSLACLAYLWLRKGDAAGALTGLRSILGTPANVAYWFLYALIPMYLLIPLLKPMADHLDQRRWRYALGLWLALTVGLATVRSFLPADAQGLLTEHPAMNLNAIGGYLGYFLLGAYLDRLEKLPSRRVLAWGTAIAAVLAVLFCVLDSWQQHTWSGRFTDYLTLFTALRAAGAFLLMKSLFGHKETKSRTLRVLSGCSFAVYLAHPLVVMEAKELWYQYTKLYDPVTIPQQLFLYAAVLGVCVLGALVLASVPGLCRLFTGQSFPAACKSSNLWALFGRKVDDRQRA